jgi:hypothetical protein
MRKALAWWRQRPLGPRRRPAPGRRLRRAPLAGKGDWRSPLPGLRGRASRPRPAALPLPLSWLRPVGGCQRAGSGAGGLFWPAAWRRRSARCLGETRGHKRAALARGLAIAGACAKPSASFGDGRAQPAGRARASPRWEWPGNLVAKSCSAAHTLSQNVTTVVLAGMARACHEMNVIWRQPGLSSVGIGGGVGGYSPGLPSRRCCSRKHGRINAGRRILVPALAMVPGDFCRRIRAPPPRRWNSQTGTRRAKLPTPAGQHGIEGKGSRRLTCIALLRHSVILPAWQC